VAPDCQGGGAMADGGVRRAESEGLNEREIGKKKNERMWFLNPLMFIGCHVTNEHKRTTPHVPCPLTFVSLPHHRHT
jgi:hypothetical protein